ncbi:hypothetical protein CR513_49886, partial [Mucuna pruriens]
MVTLSVQLSKFDISYESKGHVIAQALADFITEMAVSGPAIEENSGWLLSVDGAPNQSRSEAGVILEGPNKVEYEALLTRMRLTNELKAKTLTAKSNSKLIIGQVNGEYQARDPQLTKYLKRATGMASTFEKFKLHHVPRE